MDDVGQILEQDQVHHVVDVGLEINLRRFFPRGAVFPPEYGRVSFGYRTVFLWVREVPGVVWSEE